MTPPEFVDDLRRAVAAIRAAGGRDLLGYRAPEWSMRPHTLWALGLLRREGLRYDSSMVPTPGMGHRGFPRLPCRLDTPEGSLLEFPLSTATAGVRVPYSGGLALRLAPLPLVAAQLRRLARRGQPGLVYVHPWEFDPGQPTLRLPWSRQFMHYWNLAATPRKLARLLREFRFAPLAEVLGLEARG
jgi:hypothetical protein